MEACNASNFSEITNLVYAPLLRASYSRSDLKSQNGSSTARRIRRGWNEPKPRGLWNSGQSCHLGSAIVALSAIPALRDWLSQFNKHFESPFSILTNYLLQLAPASGYRRALDPRPALALLEQSGWKSRHAQDAHETMARVLEILEDGSLMSDDQRAFPLKVKKAHDLDCPSSLLCLGRVQPVFTNMRKRWGRSPFSALAASSNHCHSCGYESPTSLQSNFLLTLPVPRLEQTLSELLVNTWMSSEQLEMRCDDCMTFGAHTRSSSITRFPEVLVLHLQKAIYLAGGVGSSHRHVALTRRLEIPVPGVDGKVRRVERYVLRSVVRHTGVANSRSSHFNAVVAQDCSNIAHGLLGLVATSRWWLVDDDHVLHCSDRLALNPAQAYLVVYDNRSSISARQFKHRSLSSP